MRGSRQLWAGSPGCGRGHASRLTAAAVFLAMIAGCRDKAPTSLVHTAHGGDIAAVREALARGADVNALEKGVTPLFAAVVADRAEIVEVLLQQGARLAVAMPDGPAATVVHYLAAGGGVESPPQSSEAGPTYFAVSSVPGSPERAAAHARLRQLLEQGADVGAALTTVSRDGGTPLHVAAAAGDAEIVRALVEAGSDLTAYHPPGSTLGRTPLLLALGRRDPALVAALVTKSPAPSLDDCRNLPILKWLYADGAWLRDRSTIEVLAAKRAPSPLDGACRTAWMSGFGDGEKGADALRAAVAAGLELSGTPEGAIATELAVWTRDEAALAVMREHAPESDARVFVLAAAEGWQAAVEKALTDGASTSEDRCAEALMGASVNGHLAIVGLLAKATCPKDAGAWDDALVHARLDTELFENLVKGGARLDAVSTDGETALHHAARAGNREVVDWLVSRGADPARPSTPVNGPPVTPIDCAEAAGHRALAEHLRSVAVQRGGDAETRGKARP